MIVSPSQPISIVRDQVDTDGLPAAGTHTAVLWKNGATTAEVVTVTNPATGVYKFSFTIPADAVQYDIWSLRVVDGAGYPATVWEGQTGPIAAELDSAVMDEVGYLKALTQGVISDAGTAGETYITTFAGATYQLDYSGLDSSGNRTGLTRTKS